MAVVGLGYGLTHVAEASRLTPLTRLSAVVDVADPRTDPRLAGSPELADVLGVPHFRSLEDLLAEQVPDIVAIATPIHTHAALATAALRAGSGVLLEKPPTATLDEFEKLTALTHELGGAVQVGFQVRGGAAVPAIRAAIADGTIGTVSSIGVVGRWVRDRAYYERARWAGRRELDGAVVMDGALTNPLAHSVEAALSIAGATRTDDVAEVEIDAWHAHDIEADDTTSAVITTSGGIRIGVGLTLCSADPRPPTVTVYGSHGLMRLRYEHDSVDVVTDAGTVTTVHPRRSLLANLAEHLDTGAELLAPIGSTGAFMRVLETSRVGEPPAPVPDGCVTWIGDGSQAHPEIADVDEWCERAGRAGATFTALGAPWTAGRGAD